MRRRKRSCSEIREDKQKWTAHHYGRRARAAAPKPLFPGPPPPSPPLLPPRPRYRGWWGGGGEPLGLLKNRSEYQHFLSPSYLVKILTKPKYVGREFIILYSGLLRINRLVFILFFSLISCLFSATFFWNTNLRCVVRPGSRLPDTKWESDKMPGAMWGGGRGEPADTPPPSSPPPRQSCLSACLTCLPDLADPCKLPRFTIPSLPSVHLSSVSINAKTWV